MAPGQASGGPVRHGESRCGGLNITAPPHRVLMAATQDMGLEVTGLDIRGWDGYPQTFLPRAQTCPRPPLVGRFPAPDAPLPSYSDPTPASHNTRRGSCVTPAARRPPSPRSPPTCARPGGAGRPGRTPHASRPTSSRSRIPSWSTNWSPSGVRDLGVRHRRRPCGVAAARPPCSATTY